MRSVFHSYYGYFTVTVTTTVCLGLGFEDASKKCFITVPVLKFWKSEVKVKHVFFFLKVFQCSL